MININITHIILSPVPSANTVVTLDYRCIGSTGAYLIVTNDIIVKPNGELVEPLSFSFDETVCTSGIELRAQANCGGGIYREDVLYEPTTSTTTTQAPTTTTSTTVVITSTTTTTTATPTTTTSTTGTTSSTTTSTSQPSTTTTTTLATTTSTSTAAPTTSTTTTVTTQPTTTTSTTVPTTTSTTTVPITTTTLAPTTSTSTTVAPTTTSTTTQTPTTTTTSTTVTTTAAPTTTTTTTVATTTTTTTQDCPDITGADIANPSAGCNEYVITNYDETILTQNYNYVSCDGTYVAGSIGSPNTQNGHAPQSITVCSQNVPNVNTNYDIRIRLVGPC